MKRKGKEFFPPTLFSNPYIFAFQLILRIHEDGIYCSPVRIERSGGFWITSSSKRPGESCSLQTAPQLPVTAASDSELEKLLRDTHETSTPPVQSPTPEPGEARITERASHRTTGDLEAVVDELQDWLKGPH